MLGRRKLSPYPLVGVVSAPVRWEFRFLVNFEVFAPCKSLKNASSLRSSFPTFILISLRLIVLVLYFSFFKMKS